MKGRTIPLELKNHILREFTENGIAVSKLAQEHNLNPNTIYTWLKKHTGLDNDKSKLLLENARLKREKQDLIDLIGRLTVDVDKLNKKKDKLF